MFSVEGNDDNEFIIKPLFNEMVVYEGVQCK